MAVNPLRHLGSFDPQKFGRRRIDVIGVGATGSWITLQLAKLGVENIHVWDFDSVEEHNIPNQAFSLGDIAKPKVEALKAFIQDQTGTVITAHNEAVKGGEPFGKVVFLLVDSMDTRKKIWESGLKFNPGVDFMVETRMGANEGRVYSLNPSDPTDIECWEGTLYTSAQAQVSACGTNPSVGPTAMLVASMAVWQFVKWFGFSNGTWSVKPESELLFGIQPFMIEGSTW